MAPPDDVEKRLEELEGDLADARRRIVALEALIAPGSTGTPVLDLSQPAGEIDWGAVDDLSQQEMREAIVEHLRAYTAARHRERRRWWRRGG